MTRYFTKPKSNDDDEWENTPAPHVPTVCDHVAVNTGLVDKHGNAIMRAPNPCGFGKDGKW